MATQDDAILWAILERCARDPEGYRLDASHPFVLGLIAHGLISLRADGRAVTTEKGKEVLAGFAEGIDDEGQEASGRKKPNREKP